MATHRLSQLVESLNWALYCSKARYENLNFALSLGVFGDCRAEKIQSLISHNVSLESVIDEEVSIVLKALSEAASNAEISDMASIKAVDAVLPTTAIEILTAQLKQAHVLIQGAIKCEDTGKLSAGYFGALRDLVADAQKTLREELKANSLTAY